MLLVNFSHPITKEQKSKLEILSGQIIEKTVGNEADFDPLHSFSEQAENLIDQVALSGEEWQTRPIIVNLPSFNVIAAAVLAELHGRMGYFPSVIRLRKIPNSTPPQYEVAEIINLQNIRDAARSARNK